MIHSKSRLQAYAAALLGGMALTVVLPLTEAQADCTRTVVGTLTIDCTGTTTNTNPTYPFPILLGGEGPKSAVVNVGSDGNAASITNAFAPAITILSTSGPGNFTKVDTQNLGAPSTITGATNGVVIQTFDGADIQIGQNSAGGQGLNANVTGQNVVGAPGFGFGIAATAELGGNVSIMTAPGTTITGTNESAIFVRVENGSANVVVNGTATNPTFGEGSVEVESVGSGNISIGGSGNIAQGILAESMGTGAITIGGTGSIVNTANNGAAPFGLLTALITNAANNSDITITRSGVVSVQANQAGIFAKTAGAGNISITGTGNVTAGLTGITAQASGGNVTIAPAGSVTGSNGIVASTSGAGNVDITTVGNITGTNGFGISTTVGTGTATINVGSGSTISGSMGPLSLSGTSIVNNFGVLNFTGAAGPPTLTGQTTINNAGLLNFVDGAFTTNNWSNTTLNGLGGVLAIDLNAAAGKADELMVTNLSGTSTLKLNLIGNSAFIKSPIPVIVAQNVAPGTVITASGPTSLVSYQLQQSAGDPTFSLTSVVNAGATGAIPAGFHAILTSLNTGFFSGNFVQNGSAFIGEPTNPVPNQINGGPWIKFAGGQNDVSATTSAQNTTSISTAPSKVRTNFNGFQVGADLGVANVENTGWNTHLGFTGGLVSFATNDLLLSDVGSSNELPFMGVYGAVNGHGFFADFQVREDFYRMHLNNPAANLTGTSLFGKALSANGSAGYQFDLPQSWFIEPSGALVYSALHVDTLFLNLDPTAHLMGQMDFTPISTLLGRLGLRAGTTYVCEPLQLALQPFGSASVWHDFEGTAQTNFVSGGVSVPTRVSRIGTFGQLGLGSGAQILKTGFLGFIRADWRFGENISGYDVVGGLRYQF
jgi:Autotransporter beta-domain